MKAMLLSEYKHLELTDMPKPEVGPRDVLIAVQACGVCGSDIHGYDGSTGRRIPPLIMGHEAAGVIEEVGSEVSNFQAGQRVTFDSTVSCGKCEYCRAGRINLCNNRKVLGVSCGEYRQHGAFAEYVVVPEHIVYELPDDLPFEHAAMIEAVSVAVHAANRTPVKLGQSCVVVGTGMIGLLCVQAMKKAGCGTIIAIDLDDSKLALAKELGATHAINGKAEDLIDQVKQLTGGEGADIAVEVVGATVTIQTAINALRKGGHLTLVGNLSPNIELPLQSVVTRELSVSGSCASAGEYPECIALMTSGDIQVEPLISLKAPLEDGPALFERLYSGDSGLMKVILQPQ
ncbi:galactitol-1-phosphate 5-dehydrogenase [bacterium]|uniref:L-iditol 2-dehydrogenase n=1 Tax=Rubinisphaera brasiliensis (strain ATCC 49424 / DSM 5305 / JCM 21570 / IAM 15109 / NBRC 103401 / IFAM 1448) TaxID=756272 RepID=F0SMU5_RUBBR|nr:galactitol-1-phosphate 5-dehydrogenase [Rubinisphaera brasiliensis]ADY59949.1 L-iditol 2-dehydrogenase [Rubinisphaera brasiliensis DSM 5305]MBR9802824.1 galactitol-1-phosphate 5-dehydrogenase [bacterium]